MSAAASGPSESPSFTAAALSRCTATVFISSTAGTSEMSRAASVTAASFDIGGGLCYSYAGSGACPGSKVEILPPVNRVSRLPGCNTPASRSIDLTVTRREASLGVQCRVRHCDFPPSTLRGIRPAAVASRLEKELRISDPRTNDRIRVAEVRLVGPNGEQVGVVRIEDALRLAAEADLDLVEVAPNSKPPVAKIMDYGKFKYEEAQKAKEARRNQANTILKEVRFRLKIDTHDYETKRKHAEGFLQSGDKVKAMILFRGREQSRPEQGVRLLQRFAEDVSEFGSVESTPTIDGRNMVMVIGPHKSKATAKAEAEARRTAAKPARNAPVVEEPAAVKPATAKSAVAKPAVAKPAVKKVAATKATTTKEETNA
jgi:translation initiation factor IF-3